MRSYSSAEVKEQGAARSLIIIHGKVYDVSSYLDEHPGGKDLVLDVIGTDATEHFVQAGHSDEAQDTLSSLAVGRVKDYQHRNDQETKSALFQMDNNAAATPSQVSWRLAMAVPSTAFLALCLRLVIRHANIGSTWIYFPPFGTSLLTFNVPSTLLLSSVIALMVSLGAFTYFLDLRTDSLSK
ncbi:cytochrome b5 [Aspergillus piperis CBS 112811]|uniref:Cytochrome b5 n=1 Tax=Aspergillus piperis CBS 112811 TaxID=1448313 RepID=A0A8G1VKK5_9EURO|nr:cytochrome b5 [Aspergillus piperis CBS 112811]RAH55790.1 cytochrome b5 [Aspergillus piperis CBS 112811]